MSRSIAFHTLGCKVNQYETEAIRERLLARGFVEVPWKAPADVYVINTCTVTHEGDRESLRLVRRARRRSPGATVVVAGCVVDAASRGVEGASQIRGADLLVGNHEKARLPELLDRHLAGEEGVTGAPPWTGWEANAGVGGLTLSRFRGHTRAAIKVQDGCDLFCAFCIIPWVRGKPASKPIDVVLDEARALVANGFREVVLTGIHLGAYGRDLHDGTSLAGLVERLVEVDGLDRVRLSSIEADELGEREIDAFTSLPKVCPHFHVPLQSGNDGVLRRMNRRYTSGEFLAKVERLRGRVERVSVTTDVIVGFPGETEEAFGATVSVCRASGFSKVHVFPYSDRAGTPAARMGGKVDRRKQRERCRTLAGVERELGIAYRRPFVGEVVRPLVEGRRDRATGLLVGLTERYLRVRFAGDDGLANTMPRVRVTRTGPWWVDGEVVGPE